MMDTLTKLGQTERDEQAIPAIWQAVVEGRATPEELAKLEAAAEHDEALASLLEGFRPMTESQDDDLANVLLGATKPARAPKVARRRPTRWATRTVVALAAVAAAALFFVRPSASTLPDYRLEAATGDLEHRGAPTADLPRHHPSSALSIVLRPAMPVEGEVEVSTFVRRNGETVAWPMPVEVSPRRAVRVDGVVSSLLPAHRGPMTIVFVLAPPGSSPTVAELDAPRDEARSWQALSYSFEVLGD